MINLPQKININIKKGARVLHHHQQDGYFRKSPMLGAKLTKKMNLPGLDDHQETVIDLHKSKLALVPIKFWVEIPKDSIYGI